MSDGWKIGDPDPPPGWALAGMPQARLSAAMRSAIRHALAALPPGTLAVLLAFDRGTDEIPGPGVAQFISNCDRSTMVKALREAADRLESRAEAARVRFPGESMLPGPGRDG